MSGKFKKSDQTSPPNTRTGKGQAIVEETVKIETTVVVQEHEFQAGSQTKHVVVPPNLTYQTLVGETFHHQQHKGQAPVPPQAPVLKLEPYKRDGLSLIEGILDGDWRKRAPPKPNSSGTSIVQGKTQNQSSSAQAGKMSKSQSAAQIVVESSLGGKTNLQGRQEVSNRPELRLSLLFYRLVMKKKCQSQLGLAFSRLLLNNQKGKTMKSRISALSCTFNHLKRNKLSQAFSLLAWAKSKNCQTLTPREPGSPTNAMNPQRDQSSSHSRLPRTSRNRHEMRGTERSITSTTEQGKEDYNKLMTLSEQAKQALLKFQRFDRYIYPIESEKHLKGPIEAQLSRLQKIKSGHKGMWNTMYENELTITCLYNHMKNLYELNRELSQLDQLKGANQQLQERIKQINIQKAKQLMDLKRKGFGGGVSASETSSVDTEKLKEYQRNTEFLISTLKQTNEKARKLIQIELKKSSAPHKQLLEIVSDMITQLVQFEQMSNESQALQNALSKLIEEQNDTTRTIQNLERQKKVFEKGINDNKSAESMNVNSVLLNVCTYIITLHTTIKNLKGQGSSRNLNQSEIARLRSQLDAERTKNRQLQAKIQQLIKDKRALEESRDMVILTTWETELTTIIQKSEAKQAYQADITKQRRLLTTRKDNKFNNIISLNLNLLESMLKKDREIERLEKVTQDKPQASTANKVLQDKINKEKLRADNAEAEIARLKAELDEYRKKENERGNQKDPLQTQLNELFKICTAFEQAAATKVEEEESQIRPNNTQALELVKHRKALENRKKGTPALLPIITLLDTLMKIIVDLELIQRKKEQDEERTELQRTKQLTSIDNLTKTFMKLIEAQNTKVDENLVNRLRKNIDLTTGKIDKGADSPLSDVYEMYRNVIEVEGRLITLMEQVIRAAKEQSTGNQKQAAQNNDRKAKEQEQALNKKITQLEKQLEIQRGRFTTRETEMARLKQLQIENGKRIGQVEKMLQLQKNKLTNKQRDIANKQEELKRLKAELAAKEQQLRNNKLEMNKKEQQINAVRNESNRKGDLDKEFKAAKQTIQKHIESEKQLNKRIGELERGESEFRRQSNDLQRQVNDLQKQIGDLQRQIGGLEKQCSDGNLSIEELERTNGELVNRVTELTRQIDQGGKQNQSQRNRMRQLSDQLVEANRQIRELNLQSKELTTQNGNLTAQNTNLTNQNRDLTTQLKDLSNQVKTLNNDIRVLNIQITELSNQNTESSHIIDGLRRDMEFAANKSNQSSQQQLTLIRQEKLQLEANLATSQREKAQLETQFQKERNQLESANQKLQREIENLQAKLDRIQKQKGQTESGLQASHAREKNQLQDTIERMQRDKVQVDAQLARIAREKKQLQNALEKLSREKSQVEASLSNSNRQKSQLESTIQRLQREKNSNQSDRDSFGRERSQLQAEIDRLAREKAQHEASLQRVQRDFSELQKSQAASSSALRTSKNDLDNATRTIKQLNSDLDRQQREAQRLRDDVQRLQNDLRNNSNNNNRSQSEVNELKNQIIILDRKIVTLQAASNNLRYLEQANRSLKDQNDMLRQELLVRGTNYQGQKDAADSGRVTTLTQQVNKLISDLSKKSSQANSLQAQVNRLNGVINANEATFNNLLRDNQIMLQDNQAFFNDITRYKEIIAQLQRKLTQNGRVIDNSSEFRNKQAKYMEEIRVLRQDKSNLERDIISIKNSQLTNTSEKESKLRTEKSELEREAIVRQNELIELKNKITRLTTFETQYQSIQNDLNRARIEWNSKQENYKRTIRELESRENDMKRLMDNNASQYSQNEQKLNIEISNLRSQLNNKSSTASHNTQQLHRTLSDQIGRISSLERELSEARSTISRLQIDKSQLEIQITQRKKDYDIIYHELESRQRGESSVKAEQLEASNRRIQKQLEEVEARFKLQSQELERARGSAFVETPNSRMMQVMEEKRILQIEHARLMSHVSQENQIKVQLEEKFKAMLDDKAKYVEKIDQLQRIVHAKELDLLKHLELREESIRDLIALNKKLQKELKIINDKLSAQHKISTKVLEENLAKLQGQLAQLRRQNLQLRDEIEDLEDQLIDRSRHKSSKGAFNTGSRSRFQQYADDNEDNKYMLRAEGERLKQQLYYLQNSNEKLKQQLRQLKDHSVHSVRSGDSHHRRLGHSRVFVGVEERERGNAVQDRLSQKVKYLERQRHTLYQRLKILSVFSRIDTSNHAFIQNLNRVLDNILAFLNESDEFSESIITYGNFISQISESVSTDNYERYFQNVEDFLKDLFLRTFESKNEILARQAGQLIHFRQQMSELVNEQIDFIEEEERGAPRSVYSQRMPDYDRGHYSQPAGMASFIALQHLFRLYVRAKSPEVLEEIAQLLNVTQLAGVQV